MDFELLRAPGLDADSIDAWASLAAAELSERERPLRVQSVDAAKAYWSASLETLSHRLAAAGDVEGSRMARAAVLALRLIHPPSNRPAPKLPPRPTPPTPSSSDQSGLVVHSEVVKRHEGLAPGLLPELAEWEMSLSNLRRWLEQGCLLIDQYRVDDHDLTEARLDLQQAALTLRMVQEANQVPPGDVTHRMFLTAFSSLTNLARAYLNPHGFYVDGLRRSEQADDFDLRLAETVVARQAYARQKQAIAAPPIPAEPDPVVQAERAQALEEARAAVDAESFSDALKAYLYFGPPDDALLEVAMGHPEWLIGRSFRAVRRALRRTGRMLDLPEPVQAEEAEEPMEVGHLRSQSEIAPFRDLFRGRRLMVVGGLRDNRRLESLRNYFGLHEIDWVENFLGETDAAKPAVQRLANGHYDLVVQFTRFGGHTIHNAIRAACRKHRIPMLAVNRGLSAASICRVLETHDVQSWERFVIRFGGGLSD